MEKNNIKNPQTLNYLFDIIHNFSTRSLKSTFNTIMNSKMCFASIGKNISIYFWNSTFVINYILLLRLKFSNAITNITKICYFQRILTVIDITKDPSSLMLDSVFLFGNELCLPKKRADYWLLFPVTICRYVLKTFFSKFLKVIEAWQR